MSRAGGSSGKSGGDRLFALAQKWERDASDLDRSKNNSDYSAIERRLLEMHARVKRGCAQELKIQLARGS